jgi:hypothetical protein
MKNSANLFRPLLTIAAFFVWLYVLARWFVGEIGEALFVRLMRGMLRLGLIQTLDIFDTNVLIKVVPTLLLSQNWLLDKFFPSIYSSDSEFVSIDVDIGKRRMSPFVSPLVAGKLVEQRTYQTNTFKPAYIKDKRAPDLRKPVRRQIGERIGGELTGEERMMANLQFEMADQIDMLNRRLEWMAAQVLQAGSVTIAGDGFPTVSINFNRDPSLTITLIGADDWNAVATTATPAFDIEEWCNQVLLLSGAVITDLVFSPSAWQFFLADPRVRDAVVLDTSRARELNKMGAQVELGVRVQKGAIYKGNWGGFDCWIYNDWYLDDTGLVQQRMLPDGGVLGCGPDLMGTRAFGQIMDPDFNYGPLPFAPKTWVEKDPAQRLILMQSSPIVIPARVNAAFYATVTATAGMGALPAPGIL